MIGAIGVSWIKNVFLRSQCFMSPYGLKTAMPIGIVPVNPGILVEVFDVVVVASVAAWQWTIIFGGIREKTFHSEVELIPIFSRLR